MNKAIFIDKDGTLIEDVPYNVNPDLVRFTAGAFEALRMLKDNGYLLIMVSNQSGVARGYFTEDALEKLKVKLQEMLSKSGVPFDDLLFCPHHPDGTVSRYSVLCECRKPRPGMILQAAKKFDIDLSESWMIGDILHDVEAGNHAGCRTILINNGNETEWILSPNRQPTAIAATFNEAALMIIREPTSKWKVLQNTSG
jgi:D-glycero-D-manno-heptose 1,7-bisphosphate phosphatase